MNALESMLIRFGLLKDDLDYHLLRASMVIIFLAFGYQKWWEYEAQVLIPYISNGPLIFWLYPVFGIRGASWFLGVSEWLFGALLFLGFWNKKLGILRALGSCATFVGTVTIIPFMPNGWAPAAGGARDCRRGDRIAVAFCWGALVGLWQILWQKSPMRAASCAGVQLEPWPTTRSVGSDGLKRLRWRRQRGCNAT